MNVLWLGGGCGAGKTTMARRLAYRLDLQLYPVDAYAFAHEARATPQAYPLMSRASQMSYVDRHVTPTVQEQVDSFVGYSRERFTLIREDLAGLADGPPVLAEGPSLLPPLVASMGATRENAMWLLPTTEFTARSLNIRAEPKPTSDDSDMDRADRLRLARDAELTVLMRRDATRLGLPVYEVDGTASEHETEAMLAAHFAAAIGRRPAMRDGSQRAEIRRAENAVVIAQLNAFLAYLGESAPVPERQFPYVCECTTLGCDLTVPLTRAEYRSAGGALGH